MSRLGFYVLCGVLCSLVVLGQGGELTTQKPVVTPVKDTVAAEITTSSSTTTTSANTTTSTTTTPKPDTTTSSTTTTTTTTTTTPPPPPPPKPTPKPSPPGPLPPPDQGAWAYQDSKTNITCIVVQFAAQLNVTYTKQVENATSLAYVLLNVPSNASVVDGSCAANDSRQWISLNWTVGDFKPNVMTLVFLKNDTTKNYNLQSLNVTLTPELFPNATSNATIYLSHGAEWATPLATSYRCAAATRLNMTAAPSTAQAAALTMSRLQEEAFRTSTGKAFSAARECGGGDVPDAVPIAVGCALGGLVMVVLVAYLVARRRSATLGYLSM